MQERVDKDRYFLQNVIGISGVEFLFGLGLPVVVESTFLQIFLKKLGASNFAIGLIPFFFFLGTSAFALLSSYYTANMAFKRKAVIGLHLVSAISILLIGITLFIFSNVSHILFVFLGCYALFSISVGMTMPVWLNYLVTILSEDKSVAGLSFMIIAQNIAKLLSSMLILRIVDTYAFSQLSSALIFLAVGLFFILGSLLFLLTKELNHAACSEKQKLFILSCRRLRVLYRYYGYLFLCKLCHGPLWHRSGCRRRRFCGLHLYRRHIHKHTTGYNGYVFFENQMYYH
jgi:MFS family permease